MSDHDELRETVARQHRLPAGAASFLTGTSVAELDESAARFTELLGEEGAPVPAPSLSGVFGREARTRRKQQLAAILLGRAGQQRDERGRYVRPGDVHRGARNTVQRRQSPEREHNETLVELLRTRGADTGHYF